MKNVDAVMTSSQKPQDDSSIEVSDDAGGGVFKDMLEQKVTQEVEELRYTSYKVANEAKKYRYVGNGKVLKKTASQLSEKHGKIEESDNLHILKHYLKWLIHVNVWQKPLQYCKGMSLQLKLN